MQQLYSCESYKPQISLRGRADLRSSNTGRAAAGAMHAGAALDFGHRQCSGEQANRQLLDPASQRRPRGHRSVRLV